MNMLYGILVVATRSSYRDLVEIKSGRSMVKALKTYNSSFLLLQKINIIPNQNAEGHLQFMGTV
jgi:hypothetical protein